MTELNSETIPKYESFSKDNCMLIHFTDINFLPSIFSQGIKFSRATYDFLKDINTIGNEDVFGGARGTYRTLNENNKSISDKKVYLEHILNWEHFDKYVLDPERNSTEQEFSRFQNYFSLYKENKTFSKLNNDDLNMFFELVSRFKSRESYFSLGPGKINNEINPSMNVALLFDESSRPQSRLSSDLYIGNNMVYIEKNSPILGVVIYPVNLNETIKHIEKNVDIRKDNLPIYDYDMNLLWNNDFRK